MKRVKAGALAAALMVGAVFGVGMARWGIGAAETGRLGGLASEHDLSGDEAEAAIRTFTAPGKYDEYMMIASGGHSGQLHVIGVPSMQLLKTIPMFSPDSWSGYGVGSDMSNEIFAEGSAGNKNSEELTWGDSHHPALSETGGEYDGRFVYVNDRANGRLGMADLRDFKTKQIIDIPNIQTSHGGVFATPDTDYVHISSMTPTTLDGEFAELSEYKERYRGVSTFVSIDQKSGKGVLEKSFQIELPPYDQDLADAGKLVSDGFAFINAYNTEMATGEREDQTLEAESITNDFDFLHVIDWKKAEEVVAAGKFDVVNGVRMISLETAIDEGLLHFIPEPRNPHGVDVSPTGEHIVVSGKLDPNVTVYGFDKIQKAIADRDFEGTDHYGVPILNMKSVVEGQVEVGGGPLHSQFDDKGNVYTSLFVESAVAKWSLDTESPFQLLEKIPIHYNVGHLVTAEGDTVSPDGKYLVSLNKWSVDRHPVVGTLHPQNFQLIDIADESMTLLKDMPIGFGEPHYVQMIKADKLTSAIDVYKAGTDPMTMEHSEDRTKAGEERIVLDGSDVHVYMTAMRSHFAPDIVRAKEGDRVIFHITNIESTKDATHGFAVPGYNKQVSLDPGEVVTVEVEARRSGSFAFYCTEFCSALHLEMQGWLLVEPRA